jgi:hypothetical protein
MNLDKFGEYGLVGLFMGVVLFILFKMIVWVMEFVKSQTEQHNKERQTWLEIISTMKQSIDTHTQTSIEARAAQAESNRYVREEHKEMIVMLGRINGIKSQS